MTREGAVEVNAATGKKKRISKRIRDADFAKTEAPQPPEQAAQPIPGGAAPAPAADAPPLPHAPGAEREQDTAAAERVLEHIDGAHTRKASKKAARKAQAEADRFAKEQEAEGIRAVGEAEAAAIQAKGVAEAEAMEKKAEAYAKYNKAAVAEMMIKVLPDVAAKIAEPLGQIDKITIIGGDGGNNGVEQVAGNVPAVMAKLFESMKEATGIDLADIVKADTYDAKVNRNVNVSGIDSVNLVVKDEKENPTT